MKSKYILFQSTYLILFLIFRASTHAQDNPLHRQMIDKFGELESFEIRVSDMEMIILNPENKPFVNERIGSKIAAEFPRMQEYPIHTFMRFFEGLIYDCYESRTGLNEDKLKLVYSMLTFLSENGPDLNYTSNGYTPSPLAEAILRSDLLFWKSEFARLAYYGGNFFKKSPLPIDYWFFMDEKTVEGELKKAVYVQNLGMPFEKILEQNDTVAVQILFDAGVNFDTLINNESPLSLALKYDGGPADLVFKKMVSLGTNVNQRIHEGTISLFELADDGIAAWMIENGLDIEQSCQPCSGETLLHRMALYENTEKGQLLILAGANIEAMDRNNETPLIWALDQKNIEFVKMLVKEGADVNIKNKGGKTASKLLNKLGKKDPELNSLLKDRLLVN